jgi:hypothetical protein
VGAVYFRLVFTYILLWPPICHWKTRYVVFKENKMLGMGLLGTVIVIVVIVWLVRRA